MSDRWIAHEAAARNVQALRDAIDELNDAAKRNTFECRVVMTNKPGLQDALLDLQTLLSRLGEP